MTDGSFMVSFISQEISEIEKYEPIAEIQCKIRDPNIKALVLVPAYKDMEIGSLTIPLTLFLEMEPYDGLEIIFTPRTYEM